MNSSSLFKNWTPKVSGGYAAILGVVVILGWLAGSETLIRVLPDLIPMEFNTALGFFLCGIGLVFFSIGRMNIATAAGGMAALIGLLTLFQYLFAIDLGVDRFLWAKTLPAGYSSAPRMPVNTALCFLLTGGGLLLAMLSRSKPHSFMLVVFGFLNLTLGAVAFFGYLAGIDTGCNWGTVTRMAFHTASGFIVLGLGVIAAAWNQHEAAAKRERVTIDFKLSTLVCALVTVTGSVVWVLMYQAFNDALVTRHLRQMNHEVKAAAIRLQAEAHTLGENASLLAGLDAAANAIDGANTPAGEPRAALAKTFAKFMDMKPSCLETVLIDTRGRETVRLERFYGTVIQAGENAVPPKDRAAQLAAAFRLAPGRVHFFKPEKSGEYGQAFLPVLRAVAPVFSAAGDFMGCLVLAENLEHIFQEIHRTLPVKHRLHAAGPSGSILFESKGIRTASGSRFQDRFPASAPLFARARFPNNSFIQGTGNDSLAVSLAKCPLPPSQPDLFFAIGLDAAYNFIVADSIATRNWSLMAGLLMLILALSLGLLVSRTLTRPLIQMAEAAEAAGQGKTRIRLPTDSNDEAGVLARAFDSMLRQINERTRALQNEIKERKEREEKLAFMQMQLRHAQKMEAIGELAAGVAHEINTPIQYVSGNTRFLRDAFTETNKLIGFCNQLAGQGENGRPDPQTLRELQKLIRESDLSYLSREIPQALEQSLEGLERVMEVTQSMKVFSHPGTRSVTDTDINHALESTATVARNEWKHVADLKWDLAPGLPAVPCLANEINQVFLNLIINAAHAIAEATANGENGKGLITIRTRQRGGHVEISIADTGTGIAEENKDKIFDPFFTTKEIGKGTGQGLAISRNVVVDKHGGTLDFESAPGQGAAFHISLPLIPAPGLLETGAEEKHAPAHTE